MIRPDDSHYLLHNLVDLHSIKKNSLLFLVDFCPSQTAIYQMQKVTDSTVYQFTLRRFHSLNTKTDIADSTQLLKYVVAKTKGRFIRCQ